MNMFRYKLINAIFIAFSILFFSINSNAQTQHVKPKIDLKKASNINCIVPQIAFDKPLLDQAKRFGLSNKVGVGFYNKNKKNWLLGISMNFIFGNKIVQDSFLWNVRTPNGDFLTQNGDFQGIGVYQRGYVAGFSVGKILPVLQVNANSGLLLKTQVGYMRYRINIFDRDNLFPQFAGDYKKGYDRLTAGVFADFFAGYLYFSKRKKVNAIAGFNFMYGATKGQRNFLYDVARSGIDKRADASLGFTMGWIIPIYKKAVEEKYY